MDVLSDVLRMIRLEGALFLNGEFRAPWCVNAPTGAVLAHVLLPGAKHLAICHFVLEGHCWVKLNTGEPVHLQLGDIVMFPHGDSHLMGSGLHYSPAHIDHVVRLNMPELNLVRYGGEGERAVLVCGWFSYEGELPNPLIANLPALFVTALGKRASGAWISQSIRYALQEASGQQPGLDVVTAKVAELLFVETLRGYIESLPASQTGWLSGLRDPHVGKCLSLLHADPAHDWTVAELAQAVNMSRSVLAERFSAMIEMPPMQYLKQWRLSLAAGMLKNERNSLARIAGSIGYESETAFSRAFKQAYGMSPGQWRRGVQAAPKDEAAVTAAPLH
jgi:AraC-like DNA-binding protein